jgi:hypothetical protein
MYVVQHTPSQSILTLDEDDKLSGVGKMIQRATTLYFTEIF